MFICVIKNLIFLYQRNILLKMELESKYFVFDYGDTCSEGLAFAILQVEKGILVDRFHPLDHSCVGVVGYLEDELAIRYLKENSIKQVYTVSYRVDESKRFLGRILREGNRDLNSPDCDFFQYEPLISSRKEQLQRQGIEVLVIDPRPYIS